MHIRSKSTCRSQGQFVRRRGMMTLINVVAVLLMVLMVVFVLNSGKILKRKTEQQHDADAVADAVARQKARGMNAITATNHLIGEGLAFVVLHHALGGDLLDRQKIAENHAPDGLRDRLNQSNAELDAAQRAAMSAGASTPAYDRVRQQRGIKAQAALLRGKIKLKTYLIWAYWNKVAAKAMQAYPPTEPAGVALELAMDLFERKIDLEYRILNAVQTAATQLLPLKFMLRDQVLVEAKEFTNDIVERTPEIVRETAQAMAEAQGADTAFVVDPRLPVVLDPNIEAASRPDIPSLPEVRGNCCHCGSVKATSMRDQLVKTSQLARAEFPWLNYHRQPLWDALKALVPLSRTEKFYKDASDGYAKRLVDRYMTDDHQLGLYVMTQYPAPDKGYELWAEDATPDKNAVNQVLGTLVVVYRRAESVIGAPSVYQQLHPGGQITFAQGLTYNANSQERHPHRIDLGCKRITPNRQARVSYDTLNWFAPQDDPKMPWELIAKTDAGGPPAPDFPEIRLNWQAKLVPASGVQLSALKKSGEMPAKIGPLVQKILDSTPGALLAH